MSSSAKNWIRVIVIVGIVGWPAVESYRLWVTTQKLADAQALERKVAAKLAATRAKQTDVAHDGSAAAANPDAAKP